MNNKKQKTMNWQQIQSDHSYLSRSEDWPLNNADWPLPNSTLKTLPIKPSIQNPVNNPKKKIYPSTMFCYTIITIQQNCQELMLTVLALIV